MDSKSDGSIKKKRLEEIRDAYKQNKLTPEESLTGITNAGNTLLETMRKNGAAEEMIAAYARDFAMADAAMAEPSSSEGKIFSATFNYNNDPENKEITITSEGSRHWREATTSDYGSIVLLTPDEFGEFDDLGEETDEEFPHVKHTTAEVSTFSGNARRPYADGNKFEEMLIVPEEVLEGVKNEAPPGRFFSGKSIMNTNSWSPAPDGQVWLEHPFLASKHPNGTYFPYEIYYYMKNVINGNRYPNQEKLWKGRGSLAYWCPLLKRFLSEGERLGQEHWFHNGDGSAQQRYFYDQNEMLDMHGGLESLPSDIEEDVDLKVKAAAVEPTDQTINSRKRKAT